MALDSEAAVYVGRPCYFGLATTAPCTTLDWTLNRFSQGAVEHNRNDFQVIGLLPSQGANAFRDQDDIVVIPLATAPLLLARLSAFVPCLFRPLRRRVRRLARGWAPYGGIVRSQRRRSHGRVDCAAAA